MDMHLGYLLNTASHPADVDHMVLNYWLYPFPAQSAVNGMSFRATNHLKAKCAASLYYRYRYCCIYGTAR